MKGDICSITDCDRIARSSNICEVHSWRMRTYKSYDKPSRKNYDDQCRVENCDSPRDIKQRSSLCIKHRVRMSRHKSFDLPESKKMELPDGIVKICKHHGALTKEDCYKNPKFPTINCNICRNIRAQKLTASRPPEYRMKRTYIFIGKTGIRIEMKQYEEMFKTQNGLCLICKNPETAKSTRPESAIKTKRLAIDHCHTTGKIRGLLCHTCNNILGYAKDSIERLQSAIDYLNQSK